MKQTASRCEASVLGPVRRPKQSPSIRSEGLLAGTNLFLSLIAWERWKERVIPGVIANGMSRLRNLLHELWVSLGSLTNHEERRACPVPLQDVEQEGCIFRMRPIIKRKSSDGVTSHYTGNGSLHGFATRPYELPSNVPLERGTQGGHLFFPTRVEEQASLSPC